jgi:hypothetical protein
LLANKSQIRLAPNLPTPRQKVPEAREVADDRKTIGGKQDRGLRDLVAILRMVALSNGISR